MSEEDTVAHIAEEIARYLTDHPEAADSLEGIRRWWLSRQRLELAATQVERALERLTQEGAVVRTVMLDGQIVFRKSS